MSDDIPYLDTTTVPEIFAMGLYNVEIVGPVCRFFFYTIKRGSDGAPYKECVATVIVPMEAVAPAIALTLKKVPSETMVPAFAQLTKHLPLN